MSFVGRLTVDILPLIHLKEQCAWQLMNTGTKKLFIDMELRQRIKTILRESNDGYYTYAIADISNRLGLKIKSYISSGSASSIYELDDGRILKLTQSDGDINFIKYFYHNPNENVITFDNIYDIEYGYENIFAVILNKATHFCTINDVNMQNLINTTQASVSEEIMDVTKCNIGKVNGDYVIVDGVMYDNNLRARKIKIHKD